MALVKLLIVFALIVVILKFKLPLYAAMGAAIVSTIVLYQLPFVGSLETLLHATIAKDTIEENILKLQEKKSLLAELAAAPKDESAQSEEFSVDDILAEFKDL